MLPARFNQELGAISVTIKNAVQKTADIKGRCIRVADSSIKYEFAASLKQRKAEAVEKLGLIQNELNNGSKPGPIWDSLRKTTQTYSEPVFAEYVEFLGGVALRVAGFDEGIGRVCDQLWKSYISGDGSDFLAIPARQQALQHTFTRILRVAFPGWTILPLPATALEFWKVVAFDYMRKNTTLQARLANLLPGTQPANALGCDGYLGDAYATYTMGPSYALFAISLMLDPASCSNFGHLHFGSELGPFTPEYHAKRR
jgi:hypothetical protein